MAAPIDLTAHATVEMHQGDTRRLRFTVLNGTGAAKDLTGVVQEVEWAIYPWHSTTASATKTLTGGGGITVPDAASGIIQVAVDKGDTSSLTPGIYEDELRIEYTTGEEEVIAFGLVDIRDRRVGE